MDTWSRISADHPGWTLTEIKALTHRERMNWIKRENAEVRVVLDRMGIASNE